MMWERLKLMRCPKDNGTLTENMLGYRCENEDFQISKAKFDEVVQNLYLPKRQRPRMFEHALSEESNLSALNNLGRNKMSDDYSDAQPLS